jgi:NAD(P)-dependent dehydrogenase (short-subunit alcohol dehydrogenase family)
MTPLGKKGSHAKEIVLVTGSSSGIGKACCDWLQGTQRVVIGASRTGTPGALWDYIRMDVTDDHSVQATVEEVVRRKGRIDVLVHCAGVCLSGPFEATTVKEARSHFETNYFGTVRVVRAVLPIMRKQGAGRILIIGSIGGLISLPYVCHYSAGKFALDGLVEALRTEIAPFGIEATVLHPGDIKTAIAANQIRCRGSNEAYIDRCRKALDRYDENVEKGRSPDVVAKAVARLLSRRRLPPRYVVGTPTETLGVWSKAVLPAGVFEQIFRMWYGL